MESDMTCRYTKVGNDWCVRAAYALTPGETVTVEKSNGDCNRERVGEFVERNRYGDYCYQIVKAEAVTANVGDLTGILALFNTAKTHLKRPAIVLGLPHPQNRDVLAGTIRINVAGERAAVPGSLTVLDGERDEEGSRDWYGRILLNGVYQPSRTVATGQLGARIIDRLREFAADPDGIAKHSAKLTGKCCYCNRALEDDRSTAVGYGPVCAKRFGRPWGAHPAAFAAKAA
jgi:hypothetical protein